MFASLNGQYRKRSTKFVVLAIVFIAAGGVSACAIWGSLHKPTTLAATTQNISRLTLLTFLGVVSMLSVALPAKFLERQRGEERERLQQANDPLIVLESRRELFDSLDMEIKRSRRSQGSVAFLRIQFDGWNRTSNEYGHGAGDNPACRVAQVLQASCRELDIVMRYDHDEFAVVFPEAGPETVRHVKRRIRERLAGDRKLPTISVRFGAAMFPEEGKSIDTLLLAADRDLCGLKLARVAEARPRKARVTPNENLYGRESELRC
jgi:diguanylate cyclase (GGDEF)-like protein